MSLSNFIRVTCYIVTAGVMASCRSNAPITTLNATSSGQIIFRGEGGDLDTYPFVINPDGSNLMRMRRQLSYDDWSADGAYIVYTEIGAAGGDNEIMTLDVQRGVIHRRTVNTANDYSGAWSPDGSQIVFVSDRDGAPDLYIMDADGSNPTRLTFEGKAGNPAWSPDGLQIAFEYGTIGEQREIYRINVDGTNQINLTNGMGAADPEWSPDGSLIAFMTAVSEENIEVFVMNADGSNPVNLTNHDADDWAADWSPDGTQIAFMSDRSGLSVYLMNADGSNQRYLADGWAPIWHP